MECPGSAIIGQRLYQANPNCVICYYSAEKHALEPLFASRPLCYYRTDKGESLIEKLNHMVSDYTRRVSIFQYDTRKTHFHVPVGSIKYFQSDLKHVNMYYADGQFDSIFGKLSDIEQSLNESGQRHIFIRCHKSFLVNQLFIEKLDKASSFLCLTNGERVPVSKMQYPRVLQRLMLKPEAEAFSSMETDSDVLDMKKDV